MKYGMSIQADECENLHHKWNEWCVKIKTNSKSQVKISIKCFTAFPIALLPTALYLEVNRLWMIFEYIKIRKQHIISQS
jgi:hypothetical protein